MYHVQTYKAWVLVLAAAATLPCSLKATPPAEGAAPNIVLVVLDDVGTDRLAFYGEGRPPPPRPSSQPWRRVELCSPTHGEAPLVLRPEP